LAFSTVLGGGGGDDDDEEAEEEEDVEEEVAEEEEEKEVEVQEEKEVAEKKQQDKKKKYKRISIRRRGRRKRSRGRNILCGVGISVCIRKVMQLYRIVRSHLLRTISNGILKGAPVLWILWYSNPGHTAVLRECIPK
jgi:hypothetical protein